MGGSTISGTVNQSVTLGAAGYADPLTITATGTVHGTNGKNYNVIGPGSAGSIGVTATLGGGGSTDIVNYGVITGGAGGGYYGNHHGFGGGDGVYVGAGIFINDGRITGGAGGGVVATPGNGGVGVSLAGGVFQNNGTISGGPGGAAFFRGNTGATGGALLLHAGTFINAGLVNGAVSFTDGAASAVLGVAAGGSFSGAVSATGNSGAVLELTGTTAFDLAGIGTSFTGFTHLSFGAAGTIEGNIAGLATQQTIAGFSGADTIILDGFSASGASRSSAGLVLTNGTTPETLNIGIAHGNYFAVSAANNQTTIGGTNVIGYTVATVTLATNQMLTISNSGRIAPPAAGGVGYNGTIALYAAPGVTNAAVLNDGIITGGKGANGGIVNGSRGYQGVNAGSGGAGADLLGGVSLTNAGRIIGGAGGTSSVSSNGNGGDGADLGGGGTLTNLAAGVITGGAGGSTHYDYYGGGSAGAGASLAAGAVLTNAGMISGGNVVDGKIKTNGVNGGTGVNLAASDDLINSGTITGGKGGASVFAAGAGGTGLNLQSSANAAAATVTNSGVITGGSGETGYYGYPKNRYTIINPGNGGVAVNLAGAATLTNSGKIIGGAAGNGVNGHNGNGGNAANLGGGAVLINQAAGVITGGGNAGTGVSLAAGGTLMNAGIVRGGTSPDGYRGTAANGGIGADVAAGAYLGNRGTIAGGQGGPSLFNVGSGGVGLNLRSGATATNSGHIFGGQAGTSEYDYSIGGASGAVIGSGATLSNSGVITGGQGGTNNIDLGFHDVTKGGAGVIINGGVLIDGGTISGGAGGLLPGRVGPAGDAVDFTGAAGTLVVEQGAVFNGNVVANSGAGDLLEVTGNVDLAGVGTQFLNFGGISFASGAAATVEGNSAGLGAGVTINGFTGGDTLILDGFVVNPAGTTYVANTGLELTDTSGNRITLDIVGPPNAATGNFRETATPGGTSITYIACFAAGTRILCADGRRVAVETLAVGDALETQDGSAAAIIWIGRRGIDLTRHARPEAARPVLIAAGALGGGLPLRDLLVSPDHGMCLGDHLIPAKALTNGASIRQIDCDSVTYYHIELASHAVIFAEGAAAESYLDTGNRGAFENAEGAIIAHPDFAQTRRVALGCLPFAESGPAVEAARRRLLRLANIATTKAPATVIRYEGGGAMIASRHAIPGEINADPRDRRRLGIKIATIEIAGRVVPIDDPALAEGWHAMEPDGRWTNGAAVIPATLLQGAREVRLGVVATLDYPVIRNGHKAEEETCRQSK